MDPKYLKHLFEKFEDTFGSNNNGMTEIENSALSKGN